MTPPEPRLPVRRAPGLIAWACASLLGCLPTLAAEKTYQYYRFTPTRIWSGNSQFQLSEFDLKLGGTELNLNNKDASGIDVVNVTATTTGIIQVASEGPDKVVDGLTTTKWFQNDLSSLVLTFAGPVTIDEYNWTSANDSVEFSRNPVSWEFYGSTDGTNWDLLDARSNYPIANFNYTEQAGFVIPEQLLPQIHSFGLDDGGVGGVPGVVLNGGSIPLAWETEFADAVDLSPGPGSVALIGSTSVTPPNNSTAEYTLTATQTGTGDETIQSIKLRSVSGGTETFRYVRFTATTLRSGLSTGIIQLTEFEFLNGGALVPVTAVTNPGGSNPAAEGITNLTDGILTNKWLDFNNQPVVFDFGAPSNFDSYGFVTGNDAPDRDPIQWTLEGSDDATTWTLIENIDYTYPTPEPRQTASGDIPLPGDSLPPAIVTFTGDALTIIEGQPLTLTWEVLNAASVTVDGNPVGTSGSTTVTPPPGQTTYTLVAQTTGGAATATADVTVDTIAPPAITTIDYDDFSSSGDELELLGSATINGDRLQLTPELNSQSGTAWFRSRQNVAGGFEATFGLNMNKAGAGDPADGISFMIQNNPSGSGAQNVASTERGLTSNSLNISFLSYVTTPGQATVIVSAGETELEPASAFNTPGVRLLGIGANAETLAVPAGSPSYPVRIVYVPGDLDVYIDGIAVLQNVNVDLSTIGAVDGSGTAYVGFGGRTGGLSQAGEITSWHMRYGDFTETLPFGLFRVVPQFDRTTGDLVAYDIVWNAEESGEYDVVATNDFVSWNPLPPFTFLGVNGQLGYRVTVDTLTYPAEFYRVEDINAP